MVTAATSSHSAALSRRTVFRAPASSASRPARSRRRSLAAYLLVPRPKDLSKAALLPTTFGVGALAAGGVGASAVLRMVVVLAAVELLIYAARYQWNDIRGFVADQRHPAEEDRGRLPGPLVRGRRHVLLSGACAVARLAVLPLLAFALPTLNLWPLLGWVALGVFAVAVVYEALRTLGTGRSTTCPPPVRPALVLIWVTIGAGYAFRGLVGLALAVDLGDRPGLAAAAGLTLWCGGILFATTRWAVEATAFGRVHNGEVRWNADARHAREHLLALTRWLPSTVRTTTSTGKTGAPLSAWAPLRGGTPLTAPWNLALLLGAAGAGLTGALLAGRASAVSAAAAALLAAAAALAVAGEPRRRWAVVALGTTTLGAVLFAQDAPHLAAGVLPWAILSAAYVRFTGHALQPAGGRRRWWRALGPLGRLVIGRPTWDLLAGEGRR